MGPNIADSGVNGTRTFSSLEIDMRFANVLVIICTKNAVVLKLGITVLIKHYNSNKAIPLKIVFSKD